MGDGATAARIAVYASLSYAFTYFWRYPIFMMPTPILTAPIVSVYGKSLDLQACFSMAFVLGFGAAKVPALLLVTSNYFFAHRKRVLFFIMIASMLVECVGVLLFGGSTDLAHLMVPCVFLSSFLSSFLWGGMVTYLEGRERTELMLAATSAAFVYAGALSRALAAFLITLGLPAQLMPLAIGVLACSLSCLLLARIDREPPPSSADVEARCAREPMGLLQCRNFVWANGFGVCALLLAYAALVGIRSYRDFYAQQIFGAALGRADTASSFLLADLPGAVLSSGLLVLLYRLRDSKRALLAMLAIVLACLLVALLSTRLFEAKLIGGLSWLLIYSGAFFSGFGLLGTPVYERLFAATRTRGTCAVLVFASDGLGYAVTIALLLYQSFGASSAPDEPEEVLALFLGVIYQGAAPLALLLCAALAYFRWRVGGTCAVVMTYSLASEDAVARVTANPEQEARRIVDVLHQNLPSSRRTCVDE